MPGYQLLKTKNPDGSANDGGAIYIKSSLTFQTLPNFYQPHLQSCAILLHLKNIPTALAAIYSPPRHNMNIQNYIDYFSTIIVKTSSYFVTTMPNTSARTIEQTTQEVWSSTILLILRAIQF